jgi:hypothetical protein
MELRHFQKGDEAVQLQIYNTAAANLPKFKPATIVEIQRRTMARDFDPQSRVYAVKQNQVVGYCTFQSNGRVSFPWCLPGYEDLANTLFTRTIDIMRQRGFRTAFSAYRNDWPAINLFFENNGFVKVRDMVNYKLMFENMPTPGSRVNSHISPATPDDAADIFALDPSVFRVSTPEALKDALWKNPYIAPNALYVLRSSTGTVTAAAIFITNAEYADPRAVDASMPCFRLGAFGTEGMTAKRLKGLFSFVTKSDRNLPSIGMDLLGYAADRLRDEDDIWCYAAQVASDAVGLHAFYQRVFEKQGSFPVHERDLTR